MDEHVKTVNHILLSIAALLLVLLAVGWSLSSTVLEYFLSLSDFKVMTVAPFEMIQTKFSISVAFALTAALPYIYIKVYRFVLPGLYKKESKIVKWSTVPFFVMFSIGVLFALKVFLPIVMVYVNVFYVTEIANTVTLSNYISFLLSSMAMFGLVFCMPVVLCILSYAGVINHRVMSVYRKHVYVAVLVVGAVITPPDVFTQMLVSVPLFLLYEGSILCSYIINSSKSSNQVKVNV
ncbi:MAG: twin-arginine translocase subunit TatC [Methanosarcinaceae archaeon]